MQLFYAPDISPSYTTHTFDKEESHHMIKVMRKSEGDKIEMTNGNGYFFTGTIVQAHPKHTKVSLSDFRNGQRRNYRLHMVVAPTKMTDRYEWFLEKATEIGVDEITPVICARSERKVLKTERMQKVLISAMKQSLQCYLPVLHEPVALSSFLSEKRDGLLFVAHCMESDRHELRRKLQPDNDLTILIGPEGDFTEEEVASALESGYTPVVLGPSRYRTETAAIVACHTASLLNE